MSHISNQESLLLAQFPYPKPREIQKEALLQLEKNFENYDVFVISAPTAFGKSSVAKTIQNFYYSVSTITPTNLLVDQFLQEFPDTPSLHRLDSYWCEKWQRPCPITRAKTRSFCRKDDSCPSGCPASRDLVAAKYKKGPGIYNYYTYLAHKIYRPVLVVDEAHNLLPTIKDRMSIVLWQHDYRYPSNMWTNEQIQQWISTLSDKKRKTDKIRKLYEAVTYDVPTYIAQRTTREFNGKGTLRGEPEDADCIVLTPVDISEAPPMFWPHNEVEKIILMSATIGPKDIEQLGLSKKRILYIDCASPIPAENRPIVLEDIMSINYKNMDMAVDELTKYIEYRAEQHTGEKGVIHVTYNLSDRLQETLVGARYMFHTKWNKSEIYGKFRESPPSEGKILVACGLFEGVDLPDDLGRWQIIGKVPWGSLVNPAIRHISELDPDAYNWETLKVFIQGCGRICRNEKDYGVTYIFDGSVSRLFRDAYHMMPQWFLDAVIYPEGY